MFNLSMFRDVVAVVFVSRGGGTGGCGCLWLYQNVIFGGSVIVAVAVGFGRGNSTNPCLVGCKAYTP